MKMNIIKNNLMNLKNNLMKPMMKENSNVIKIYKN